MSAQFDSALRALESRDEVLQRHYKKVEEATQILNEGFAEQETVEVSLRNCSHRLKFRSTISVFIRGEDGELELLAYDDVEVSDPRGATQIVEGILNKVIDTLGKSLK